MRQVLDARNMHALEALLEDIEIARLPQQVALSIEQAIRADSNQGLLPVDLRVTLDDLGNVAKLRNVYRCSFYRWLSYHLLELVKLK